MTGSGNIATCPMQGTTTGKTSCSQLSTPPLPRLRAGTSGLPPAAAMLRSDGGLRAMIAVAEGKIAVMDLLEHTDEDGLAWRQVGAVNLPHDGASGEEHPEVAAVTSTPTHLLVTASNGVAYRWELRDGLPISALPVRDVPVAGARRSWQSACVLPSGKIMRLASSWQRGQGGVPTLRPELLL